MDTLSLAGSKVLRRGDVTEAGERARQRRLGRLAVALSLIALPLGVRAILGGLRYARGDLHGAASALRWPLPHLPAGAGTYLASAVLIPVLVSVLTGAMLAARPSPHG